MKTLNKTLITLAIGLALSTGAMAQSMSKPDYTAGKDKISADFKTDKAACAPLAGNAKDICKAQAKGKEKVARAELEHSYKPSAKTLKQHRDAKANADLAVAKERCDDQTGNAKDVCVKEAKAAAVAAKADAKVQLKTSDANKDAKEKTSDARKDAAADKQDAQYKVAKEKCDALSGDAKDACLNRAKASFGK